MAEVESPDHESLWWDELNGTERTLKDRDVLSVEGRMDPALRQRPRKLLEMWINFMFLFWFGGGETLVALMIYPVNVLKMHFIFLKWAIVWYIVMFEKLLHHV